MFIQIISTIGMLYIHWAINVVSEGRDSICVFVYVFLGMKLLSSLLGSESHEDVGWMSDNNIVITTILCPQWAVEHWQIGGNIVKTDRREHWKITWLGPLVSAFVSFVYLEAASSLCLLRQRERHNSRLWFIASQSLQQFAGWCT